MVYEIRVYGRVQGVGFRYFVKNKANILGIKGWVKNMPDGSVKIVCELNDSNKESFIRFVSIGPSFAHVDNVVVEESGETLHIDNFIIKY